ncbi:sodium/hydrogen exchanger 3-like [Oppia nitens]|uniref:sodium/hydrogen exchanger 3-like n=1 Tax=Oppia nitens TaxID=1686743 RepID=UPI0023DA4D76|nr:sodium/hydrogen exchanger 3-like [Oppia nitens]
MPAIKLEEQILMAYGGLRGAVAFALIAVLYEEDTIENFGLLRTTTLFIILFTVFILGSTTKPLLNYLRIRREVKEEAKLFHLVNTKKKLIDLNEKYFKKYLTHGNNEKNIEQLLQKLILKEEMNKLFNDCSVKSDEQNEINEITNDDEYNNNSNKSSATYSKNSKNDSKLDIDSTDDSSDEEQTVCQRMHNKLCNQLSQLKILSMFGIKIKSKTEDEKQANKTRKMSHLLENAFKENDRNQTILRNSVTKGQIANRNLIKQKNTLQQQLQRRSSNVSITDPSNSTSISQNIAKVKNPLKISSQLLNATKVNTNDELVRRLSLISNISNIEKFIT